MIRFLPDTWRDAVLRPLAIASPDGGVYVEIIAPDFRFVFILVLGLACLLTLPRAERRFRPVLALLALTGAAFVPWLATTGNGRYFIPFLLVAGPLCIGLLQLLAVSRSFRVALAAGMVLWQAFLVYEIDPWRTWGHVVWSDPPAFGIEVPAEIAATPATFVTLSSISYSLIAPRFHPASRWVNIATQRGVGDRSPDQLRTQALIAAPGALRVIFPTVPGGQENEHIDPALATAIDDLLARQALSIEDHAQCRLLRSPGLAGTANLRKADALREKPLVHGFWLCPLARHASRHALETQPVPGRTEEVFVKLERTCPRIFRPGETVSLRIPDGAVRGYPGSDFRLYVLDDGRVFYKYYRALNSVLVGNVDRVLNSAFTMDCSKIRGRSGMPWEREI